MLKLFLDATDEIPWEALNFVTGIINYGGRVTDDQDSRCIMTILEKFCNVKCLDDNYKFSPSGTYYAPTDGKVDVYRDYVESLPMNDLPEIFGLHENANITYQRAESMRVINTILSIQPRLATAAGGMTPDEIVLEKAKGILDELPELLDQKEGLKELFI
jgi:dynein heavy chain